MTSSEISRDGISPLLIKLHKHGCFGAVEPTALKSFADSCSIERKSRRSFFDVSVGDAGNVQFVCSGLVKILQMLPNGDEVIIDLAGPGDFIGGVASVSLKGATKVLAEVVDDAEICTLSQDDFNMHLRMSPDLHRVILKHIEARMQRTHERLVQLAFRTAEERLADFVLWFANAYNAADEPDVMHSRISQSDIGQLIGVSRQSVATILSSWKQSGMIELDRKRLVINDKRSLELISSGGQPLHTVA